MKSFGIHFAFSATLVLSARVVFAQAPQSESLERQLLSEQAGVLARYALATGDPVRGAILFYQPYLTCTKCHTAGDEKQHPLGPDLARFDRDITPAHLVESVLEPSKVIHKGYEPVTVLTTDGRTISGVLVEQKPAGIVLRDVAQDGKSITIPRAEIEEVALPK